MASLSRPGAALACQSGLCFPTAAATGAGCPPLAGASALQIGPGGGSASLSFTGARAEGSCIRSDIRAGSWISVYGMYMTPLGVSVAVDALEDNSLPVETEEGPCGVLFNADGLAPRAEHRLLVVLEGDPNNRTLEQHLIITSIRWAEHMMFLELSRSQS